MTWLEGVVTLAGSVAAGIVAWVVASRKQPAIDAEAQHRRDDIETRLRDELHDRDADTLRLGDVIHRMYQWITSHVRDHHPTEQPPRRSDFEEENQR